MPLLSTVKLITVIFTLLVIPEQKEADKDSTYFKNRYKTLSLQIPF
jgi:hypothetical protein